MAGSNLTINPARFWETIEASASIGTGPQGGLRRLALGDADKKMRDLFTAWCRDAGYSVTVDRLGSMFARREGTDQDAAPILIGSHLDTQAAGGRFDGIVGVLAGLEVLRSLDDLGLSTKRPIEVVNWTNEEGARFSPPMLASLVFAGKQSEDWALARKDQDGISVKEELARTGYAGAAPVGGRSIDAYFELHIEQGPALHAAAVPLAIVTGGYAARGMRIGVTGENAHTGPTDMHLRRNALVGASMVTVAVNEVGWRYAPFGGKSTVARIEAWPNIPGILSSEATVYVDFRAPDKETVMRMEGEIRTALPDSARRSQTEIEVVEDWTFGSPSFDPGLQDLCRETADRLGIDHMDLLSQAGHDAYHMSDICPSVLLFSPCDDGITHNEKEATRLEDQVPALSVLLNAVAARASR